jgi:GT2 family glycosyltransferase
METTLFILIGSITAIMVGYNSGKRLKKWIREVAQNED